MRGAAVLVWTVLNNSHCIQRNRSTRIGEFLFKATPPQDILCFPWLSLIFTTVLHCLSGSGHVRSGCDKLTSSNCTLVFLLVRHNTKYKNAERHTRKTELAWCCGHLVIDWWVKLALFRISFKKRVKHYWYNSCVGDRLIMWFVVLMC